MAVDHQHPLRPFALAREPHTGAAVLGRNKGAVEERERPVKLAHVI